MSRTTAGIAQAKKEAFLRAYAEQGTLLGAAQVVGISSRRHYEWLERSETYQKAFHEAEEKAIQRLEQEAIRRAVDGSEEPVFYEGKVVGTTRKKSDVLLIFLLKAKRPEVYRDRVDARFTGHVGVNTTVQVIHELHDGPAALPPPSSYTPTRTAAPVLGLPAPGEDDPEPE